MIISLTVEPARKKAENTQPGWLSDLSPSSNWSSLPERGGKVAAASSCGTGGFTLVEMLAALVAAVVIIGAATGFMLTAALREYAVLAANALEARHENLAETMTESIKAATAFQIYTADPAIKFGSPITLPPGEPSGNFLVCVRTGFIDEFAFSGNQITYTQLDQTGVRSKSYGQVTIAAPLFDANLGVIQAHWNVTTSLDLIPFNVYGMPLSMR